MEIKINGNAADITLDNEKTIGDVMAGVDGWLVNSGHRISGISVDNQVCDISNLEQIFSRDINTVKSIDISTSSITELAVESLFNLIKDAGDFEKLNLCEKKLFYNNWKESPQALFIYEQMSDLYNLYINLFSGGEINSTTLISFTEERLGEIKNPVHELSNLKQLIEEVCANLNDLALDIQTGKDMKAAQTIQIFSGTAEKILRILRQMDIQGYISREPESGNKQLKMIITDFGNIVKELLEAYERHDTVLVGDIAEYEASVKLQELYSVILKNEIGAEQEEQ